MARHRSLRCAMASASAKMPRRRVSGVSSVCLWARPCPGFLTTNAHTSERNFLIQRFCESSVTPHSALARRRVRQHHLCRRQAPLYGVSRATRQQIICPQRRCGSIHRLIQERVGRNGVGGSRGAAKIVYSVYFDGFLTERSAETLAYAASQAALHGASGAPRPQMECPQRHRAINHRLIQWRVTEVYGAQWRRRRRRCREDGFLGFPRSVCGPGPVQVS